MENLTPVVLFVYNRLDHVKETVNALKKNEEAETTELIVFADGAKEDSSEEDKQKVRSVKDYVRGIKGFKNVLIYERESNYGLAKSIIQGLNQVFERYDKAIILEDDIVVSKCFLRYMNSALDKYAENKKVYAVTGYSYIHDREEGIPEFYFLPVSSSWSWGTWRDRWVGGDENAAGWELLKRNPVARYRFNLYNSYGWYDILAAQMERDINSWAIRWYWCIFKNGGISLFPRDSMVRNGGFDGSGEHCGEEGIDDDRMLKQDYNAKNLPESPMVEKKIKRAVARQLKKYYRGSTYQLFLNRFKGFAKKILCRFGLKKYFVR